MKSIITGSYIRPDGSPAAGSTVSFALSQDCVALGYGVIVHETITFVLDVNGSLPVDAAIFGNDAILPTGTFYTVSVEDPAFGEVYHEHLFITGDSPINLDAIAPALR